jgi:hypothetical protein
MAIRAADWADDTYREFLVVAQYRERMASAKPSLTGHVSACCGAETRERRDRLVCVRCDQPCITRSWYSPLTAGSSKGGWTPSILPTKEDLYGWNLIYVNETKSRNTGAEDLRRARGYDRIKALSRLIENRPRGMTDPAWRRSLLAWKRWLDLRCYGAVAQCGVHLGGSELVWTETSVAAWIREARGIVYDRAHNKSARYPGLRLAA